jgi:phage terminase small subunit
MALNERQRLFAAEYLVDLNATQAAIRAGYSERTAYSQGQRLLKHVEVQAAIQGALAARAARTEITADDVLQRFWAIATADPNELIEFRRGACRHCYGKGHRYQETAAERGRRHRIWKKELAAAEDPDVVGAFDELGGVGFDPRRDPSDDCPECFGDGEGQAFVKDTRKLTGGARLLYAGVKVTREGLEVKLNDQPGALHQVGRHLGMFRDKHEHTGPDGGPIEQVTRIERIIVRPQDPDR